MYNVVGQIYWVRHCKAEGQPPEAPLTPKGREQAERLADFLGDRGIQRIVSSPFLRARDSVVPLASRLGMEVEIDDRLAERNLGEAGPDWMGSLSRTFDDLDLVFPGGESSRQAVARAVAALQDVVREGRFPVVMTSHGNLTTLALNHFDTLYDFSTWQEMSNPDVYFLGVLKYGMAVFRQWRS